MTATPTPATGPDPDPRPPTGLRGRLSPGLGGRYWKLWTASTISNLGDGTSMIAYPWLATVLTRDPVLVAGVGVATRLPWLLFSLHAGALVDRSDRRRIMVTMNVVRAAITAVVVALILADAMSIPALYVAALALGMAEVLHDNAAQTLMPRLVPADRLERANGNLWGAEQVTNQFVGPPLGGLLLGIGLAVPFVLDVATFAVAAGLVALIGGTYRANGGAAADAPTIARPRLRTEIAEGFRWLWGHHLLRTLAIVLGIINLASMLAFATFVLFVQEIVGLGPTGFGILTSATAVGAVLGSVLTASVTRRIGPGPSLYATLIGGAAVPLIIGLTSDPWVIGAASVLYGFVVVLWNVITVSLRQTIIPDHLLGRVNSVYRFFGWGGLPIGAFLGGAIVSLVEPWGGRELALRAPFLTCAVLNVVTLAAVGTKLTTARIQAARAEAPAAR
jgi:MFS family permease